MTAPSVEMAESTKSGRFATPSTQCPSERRVTHAPPFAAAASILRASASPGGASLPRIAIMGWGDESQDGADQRATRVAAAAASRLPTPE